MTYTFHVFFPAPSSPQFLADDCSAENNTVTVCWQPQAGSAVEGYVLELDDGNEGDFRVSTKVPTILTRLLWIKDFYLTFMSHY